MNTAPEIHILHLEDRAADAGLVMRELKREGIAFDAKRVWTEADFLAGLRTPALDLILADYSLPSYDGLSALELARKERPEVPFIFVSGTLGEETAIEAMHHGAMDYVLKQRLTRLGPSVRRALQEAQEHRQLAEAERQLRLGEERLRMALEAGQMGVWEFDLTGHTSWRTPRHDQIFGYTTPLAEWNYDILLQHVVPEDLELVKHGFAQALATDRLSVECRVARPGQEPRWIALQGRVSRNEKGERARLMGTVSDISGRKLMERVLRESERRFRLLADNASDLIWTLDTSGQMNYVSPSVERLLGYTPTEALARFFDQLLVAASATTVRKKLGEIIPKMRTGERVHETVELKFVRKDGWPVWHEVTCSGMFDAFGEFAGVVGVNRDISERKRAEAASEERARTASLAADIGQTLIRGGALRELLQHCAEGIMHDLDAAFARIWTLNERENVLELQASAGLYTHLNGPHGRVPVGEKFKIGWIALKRQPHLTNQIVGDPRISDQEWARAEGMVAFAGYPLIVEDRLVGVMAMFARHALTQGVLQALGTVADGIALGIQRKSIEEAQSRLVTAVEQSAEAIMITDAQGTMLYVNPAFERNSGYSRQEALGQNPRLIKSGKHDAAFYQQMWETLARGDVWHGHFTNKKKDGTLYEEEATISPVRDATGRIVNYVGINLDVTRETALEVQLRQSQKMEAIGTLAGGVAHEINNPINGIMNYAQLIADKLPADSGLQKYLGGITKETDRVAHIVRNLLSFARQDKLGRSPANLNDILNATLTLVQTVIRHDQITLELEVPGGLPQMECRGQQLEQVLLNLLTNARDALNEKYPAFHEDKIIRVSVRRFEQDGAPWIRTTIEDHGNGIPEGIRGRIFDPFYTTKPTGKGTGLGLSISYGLVKDHGGRLHFETETGRFTRFHMDLPLKGEK
ncbi:MAG: PAS domain S-box protein [Verrucomicrobia bacterium]|nr:PAS domain S-box protein [Verrucomicrobiota bacterium]